MKSPARSELDPVVLHAPTRISVACFGAVGLRTGILVTGFEAKFNAESFQRFLVSLLKHRSPGKRQVLVLHNAKTTTPKHSNRG